MHFEINDLNKTLIVLISMRLRMLNYFKNLMNKPQNIIRMSK